MHGLALPPVIGHRGAAALAPENTLASFALAARQGAAMVEFDVRLTADGVPVVFHDDELSRTTDGRGRVAATSLAALKGLDAGGWFSAAFAGERVPTLAEVLELCLVSGMAVNMEIKPHAGAEAETAERALDLAGRIWPTDRPPPLISSFRVAALARAAEVAPHWPRGLLVERVPADWRARAEALGCVAIHAAHRGLSARRVADMAREGLAVLAYTVNDPDRAKALWNWGVDAVFSDCPGAMMPVQ